MLSQHFAGYSLYPLDLSRFHTHRVACTEITATFRAKGTDTKHSSEENDSQARKQCKHCPSFCIFCFVFVLCLPTVVSVKVACFYCLSSCWVKGIAACQSSREKQDDTLHACTQLNRDKPRCLFHHLCSCESYSGLHARQQGCGNN